ncbi:hypothetical protein HDU76_012185, partial [Blyttiomyces sp. JEL0837]
KSFTPAAIQSSGDAQQSVQAILNTWVRLLKGPLQNTVGLLIDVRENRGGNVLYAMELIQLFALRKVQPYTMRFLQTSYNSQLWTSNPYLATSIYGQSFSAANSTSSLYSSPIPIYPTEIINLRGQVYMNPVGLITNANTFSAAELFVGMMKDFAGASVFGEDTTTGGGGGTLISSIDLNTFDNSTFISLLNGQYIKLPWAQVIRPSGALIEDVGIPSDILLSTYSVSGVSDWVSGPISTEVIAAANNVAKS